MYNEIQKVYSITNMEGIIDLPSYINALVTMKSMAFAYDIWKKSSCLNHHVIVPPPPPQ